MLTDREKSHFKEINERLAQLGGIGYASQLPVDMQVFLKSKVQEWRKMKHTAPRASTRAVSQDARHSLECISNEVRVQLVRLVYIINIYL